MQNDVIAHFGKYHNALSVSSQILNKHCSQFLLGLTWIKVVFAQNHFFVMQRSVREFHITITSFKLVINYRFPLNILKQRYIAPLIYTRKNIVFMIGQWWMHK